MRVRFSTTRNAIVEFALITEDELLVPIEYDLNRSSRDYIAGMVGEVMRQINQAREAEHGGVVPHIALPAHYGEVLN